LGSASASHLTPQFKMSKRYLAIDLGNKRTGLAVGDPESGIVTPLQVIEVSDVAVLLERIADVIKEQETSELVIGLPLNMDGTEGPRAKEIRTFADALTQCCGQQVHLVDERLSTFEADQRMGRTGLTHGEKKARRDALAASVILTDFLAGLDSK